MNRFARLLAPAVSLLALAMLVASCSLFSAVERREIRPEVRAPMGVAFGESLAAVRARFPSAQRETSPLGAPALKLTNVNDGAVHYDYVVYEFAAGHGMQLVWARFSDSSSGILLGRLRTGLGPPTALDSGAASDALDARWTLHDGASVRFDGPQRRLAILGPRGAAVRQDLAMRAQANLLNP